MAKKKLQAKSSLPHLFTIPDPLDTKKKKEAESFPNEVFFYYSRDLLVEQEHALVQKKFEKNKYLLEKYNTFTQEIEALEKTAKAFPEETLVTTILDTRNDPDFAYKLNALLPDNPVFMARARILLDYLSSNKIQTLEDYHELKAIEEWKENSQTLDPFEGITQEEADLYDEALSFPEEELIAYLFKEEKSPQIIKKIMDLTVSNSAFAERINDEKNFIKRYDLRTSAEYHAKKQEFANEFEARFPHFFEAEGPTPPKPE